MDNRELIERVRHIMRHDLILPASVTEREKIEQERVEKVNAVCDALEAAEERIAELEREKIGALNVLDDRDVRIAELQFYVDRMRESERMQAEYEWRVK